MQILKIVAAEPGGGLGYHNGDRPNAGPHADWAFDFVGANGDTFLKHPKPTWEWIPMLDRNDEFDTKLAAVAGNVITADLSQKAHRYVVGLVETP
jgi:hypothetical protein